MCDGTNGTPDLRNRFIYGGDGTNEGSTGGNKTVTLTNDNLPQRTVVSLNKKTYRRGVGKCAMEFTDLSGVWSHVFV